MLNYDYIMSLTSYLDFLKNADLPIFIYGMGDGCVKLMSIFDSYGIPCAGIFASDEFVRDKTFLGHKIHSLGEIEDKVDDFIIVLAFGAGYRSLIEKIDGIAKRHRLLVPDMPVIGGGLFTKEYFRDNFNDISLAYSLLEDRASRNCFEKLIEYKITGDISALKECETSSDEVFGSVLRLNESEIYADLGAYTGDTVEEFLSRTEGKYRHIYAIEPNQRNLRKLKENTASLDGITVINAAAGETDGEITVLKGGGRMIKRANSGIKVPMVALDSVLAGKECTYIKYDVEGSELNALEGSKKTIAKYNPKLNIAVYHRVDDFFRLPIYVHGLCPEYKLYLRHFPYYPAWDTNLYAVK